MQKRLTNRRKLWNQQIYNFYMENAIMLTFKEDENKAHILKTKDEYTRIEEGSQANGTKSKT